MLYSAHVLHSVFQGQRHLPSLLLRNSIEIIEPYEYLVDRIVEEVVGYESDIPFLKQVEDSTIANHDTETWRFWDKHRERDVLLIVHTPCMKHSTLSSYFGHVFFTVRKYMVIGQYPSLWLEQRTKFEKDRRSSFQHLDDACLALANVSCTVQKPLWDVACVAEKNIQSKDWDYCTVRLQNSIVLTWDKFRITSCARAFQ